ncbi:TetR/AcrR family transcriptional regulator [Allokutzneria sp. A3M-2-11 16]|uniref:TetR/AcrR family transcriptional regulator n=1 Tax=Allokutzneria sp. A3M-2-11 16 TaxID=2962043 RepID=UPI0020B7DF2D|nr:TetR/AcrR family transcriptional regulator [Allokutzneria sp. A3M-2-11 16]MCP3802330.1 TetR/AcrR family transcriptional regulator [Allokutzneria sp. A3M-2-11 16]
MGVGNVRGKQDRRAELLAIAGRLFAERGFATTTVREIADAAGILSGSLYHHFDSKESMVDEILRGFLDRLRAAYDRVLAEETDPRAALTALITVSFESMDTDGDAIAIFQNEAAYLSQFERFGYFEGVTAELEGCWLGVLERGQRDGVFRADLRVPLVYRFIRDTVWVAVRWYDPKGALGAEEIAAQYLTILCQGIVAQR